MGQRIKRTNDELKASRPTLKEMEYISRVPISFIVENVRSVHNVGSIFRSADGFGAEKLYLTGYTAFPPRDDLRKVALGAEDSVPWEHHEDPIQLVKKLKNNGYQIVALEQTIKSVSIYEVKWQFPICIILGNEVTGISEELISFTDFNVEIPMHGIKQSLNVSVAAGVIGYEIARIFNLRIDNVESTNSGK